MCTVVVRTRPFLLLSNRDEFLERPSAPLEYHQGILAGRDLRSGGAWLGFGPTVAGPCSPTCPARLPSTRPRAEPWCKIS